MRILSFYDFVLLCYLNQKLEWWHLASIVCHHPKLSDYLFLWVPNFVGNVRVIWSALCSTVPHSQVTTQYPRETSFVHRWLKTPDTCLQVVELSLWWSGQAHSQTWCWLWEWRHRDQMSYSSVLRASFIVCSVKCTNPQCGSQHLPSCDCKVEVEVTIVLVQSCFFFAFRYVYIIYLSLLS